jgi:hypothetical protein
LISAPSAARLRDTLANELLRQHHSRRR